MSPKPIQIGSRVQPLTAAFARDQAGGFVPVQPGECYEVEALGSGFAILRRADVPGAPALICQTADLQLWE